ncbi:hypothetical protein G6F56_012942 [Rhizopus delemar]|nr:hypothetical protein G6F56_012942 [Rhizopus delemar]
MRVSTPARSNVVAAALAALATAPRPYSPVLEEQEDPFEYLHDDYDGDGDYDFPVRPPVSGPTIPPTEDDEVYYDYDGSDFDSDDDLEDEPEIPHQTFDNSKIPTEQVAYVLFNMVTVFQAGRMTEEDTEMMMEMCNVALEAAGEEYRFPKKASTVSNHNKLQERACIGLMSCPVCVKCCKVVSPTSTDRICSECRTELYKSSSNVQSP